MFKSGRSDDAELAIAILLDHLEEIPLERSKYIRVTMTCSLDFSTVPSATTLYNQLLQYELRDCRAHV